MYVTRWKSEVFSLPEDHGWTARPGHKILVLDQGAVLFEFPASWVVEPGADSIEIRDRATREESNCLLAVSYLRLPPMDWSGLPLSRLLLDAVEGDDRERIAQGPVIEVTRDGLELVWTELRVVDPGEGRQAVSRLCLARGANVQALITLDFWPEEEARVSPVWGGVLSSLELGVHIEEPTRRRRLQ